MPCPSWMKPVLKTLRLTELNNWRCCPYDEKYVIYVRLSHRCVNDYSGRLASLLNQFLEIMRNLPAVFIDDDNDDLDLIKEMVTEMQFPNEVLTFTNPEVALAFLIVSKIEPLFIVCDINMPKMDGYQLRKQLLNSNSKLKDVPFMFFSTMQFDQRSAPGNELKVYGSYLKPSTFKGMKETLTSILSSLELIHSS